MTGKAWLLRGEKMPRRAAAHRLWTWFVRRPLALFLVTTFLISYGIGFPVLILASWFIPSWLPEPGGLYAGRIFVVFGPTCGAVAAVMATEGRNAVKAFLGRNLRVQRERFSIILILPIVTLGVSVAAHVAAGTSLSDIAGAIGAAWPLLVIHFALQILIIGLGEEIGWRGWLLPRLAARHGIAMATLVTGLIWYVWHLPILLQGVLSALSFAVAIAALSALFTIFWVQAGERAYLAAIAHGCVNAPLFFFPAVLPAADHDTAWYYVIGIYAAIALAAVAGLRVGPWRQSRSQAPAEAA
jgi:membrane protease YdiL (CAAX protease family)